MANDGTRQHDYCTLCGKKSNYKCDRCDDFYCSEICQKRDWPNHRFICFPIPKLVKVGQPSISVKDNQPDLIAKDVQPLRSTNGLPNGSCVLLSAFQSSNQCFIRSTNPSTVAEYNRILNEINEFGKTSNTLSQQPKSNSFALILRGDKWCRVKILGKNRDLYQVAYIDFGDTCKANLKSLRNIAPHVVNFPCFLQKVKLKGVAHNNQQNTLKSLTQFTNKEFKVEFVKPDTNGGNVELFHWGTTTLLNSIIQSLSTLRSDGKKDTDHHSNTNEQKNKNANKMISTQQINNHDGNSSKAVIKRNDKQNGDTKMFKPETKDLTNKVECSIENPSANGRKTAALPRQIQMKTPCLVPPFETIPINKDDINCYVRIVDDSYIDGGYIGCILEKHCDNLQAVSQFLKQWDVDDQFYKPKFKEYCLANFENEWYRAKVVEILSEDKFLVVYIDFTNEKELTSESIRRYPLSLNLPCYTTLCALGGLPENISPEIKSFLELNCASFTKLKIDSIRIDDDEVRYIKSNELLNKLHDSKLV